MNNPIQSIYLQTQKEINRQWKFSASVVNSIGSNGQVNTTSAGRPYARESIGNVYPTKLSAGDAVLHLGSTMNDISMAFGRSPWTCG